MTIFVIDGDRSRQFVLRGSGNEVFVTDGSSLTVDGEDALIDTANTSDGHIQIDGFVGATGEGVAAIRTRGTRMDVVISGDFSVTAGEDVAADIGVIMGGALGRLSNSGGIDGATTGVLATGKSTHIGNNGIITADDTAVVLRVSEGLAELNNAGTIEGDRGVFVDGRAKITNSQVIEGTGLAIDFKASANEGSTIINAGGKILTDGKTAVRLGSGDDKFINGDGTVTGRIQLGGGDDRFVNSTGTFDKVEGGGGNDLYLIADGAGAIVEKAKGGIDTVRSSASHMLADNVEILVLQGFDSIDGIGNAGNNRMTGNQSGNVLSGLEGNDILTGGDGDDTFRFFTGFGKDVITDYEIDVDGINLSGWSAIDGFDDLMDNDARQDGKDMVFKAGADSLTLKNVKASQLEESDFLFVV